MFKLNRLHDQVKSTRFSLSRLGSGYFDLVQVKSARILYPVLRIRIFESKHSNEEFKFSNQNIRAILFKIEHTLVFWKVEFVFLEKNLPFFIQSIIELDLCEKNRKFWATRTKGNVTSVVLLFKSLF